MRKSVLMDDPLFLVSVSKVANLPITILPSGLACRVELFLGVNDTTKAATSGLITFTSTGAQQSVPCPITMPASGGAAYHVYMDVDISDGANWQRFAEYQATNDIIIPSGSVGPVTWS